MLKYVEIRESAQLADQGWFICSNFSIQKNAGDVTLEKYKEISWL
jgi:hypothetical protein